MYGVVSHERKNNGVVIPPDIRGRYPPRSKACYDGKSLQNGQGNCRSVEIWHARLVICIAFAVAAIAIGRHYSILGMSSFAIVANIRGLWRKDGNPREGMIRSQGPTQ